MENIREHKNGLLGSALFHGAILILLLLFGFFTKLPLPEEQGFLVNFGNSESGFGDVEPSPAVNTPEPTQTQPQQPVSPAAVIPPPVNRTEPQPSKDEIMTQDYEKTVALETARKKREEDRKNKEILDEEIRKQKELDRQRQLEITRQQQAEAERKRVEAEAKKKAEDEQRRIAEIDSRTKGAFGTASGGTGGTGSGSGSSQGATYPGGNQGTPTGDPKGGSYGTGGSGSGTSGSGISYSLAGRTATSTPKPNYPGREEGSVVVTITVDKFGKVTQATPGARGSTTMNPDLLDAAKRAALQAKFNLDNNAETFQTGTITYRFVIGQ